MCCASLQKVLKSGKDECFTPSTVAKENDREFRIINKSKLKICKVKIDDCFIKDGKIKKCDYLFKLCGQEKFFLVELKGNKVKDAVEQILSTFEQINNFVKMKPENYTGYIISSTIPASAEQNFKRLLEDVRKNKGIKITKFHSKYQLTV